jgi:MFS family permease
MRDEGGSPATSTAPRGRLAASLAALGDVVANPRLRRAEMAYGLVCAGESAFTVALAVVAYRHGGARAVGVVVLVRMLPAALASPVLSVVADRMRRERVLAIATTVRAVVIGAAAVLLETGAAPAVIYLLAVVATIAMTTFRPAHSALLPSLCTTTRELTSANVVRGILEAGGALAGPVAAGVLLAAGGPTPVFVGVAGLSMVAAWSLGGVRSSTTSRPAPVRAVDLGGDAAAGVRAVVGHRDLRLVFGLGFAQTLVRGALAVFTVVVAFELLGTGDAGVGALSAAVGAGGLLGSLGVSLLVGSRHLGVWLAVALVLWGAPIAVMALVPTAPAAFALLAVVGLGNAMIDIPIFTLPVRLADDALLARVFGVLESLVALGVGVGSVITPLVISRLGLRAGLVAVGLVLPALALLCVRRLVALDGRLVVRDEEIAVLRNAHMLAALPVASLEHLASRVRRRGLAAGSVLFEQGTPGDAFYVIVEGTAEVVGDGARIRTLGPGDSFGEIALVRDVARTATVRALDDLTVFELDRDEFLHAIGGHTQSVDAARAVVARHLASFTPATV